MPNLYIGPTIQNLFLEIKLTMVHTLMTVNLKSSLFSPREFLIYFYFRLQSCACPGPLVKSSLWCQLQHKVFFLMYTSLKFKLIVALFDQFHLCVKVNISSWLNNFLFKNINFQKSIGYILIVFNFQQRGGVEIALSVQTGARYDIHFFWKLI